MDYENDIKIDENALDVEWLDQASLAMKYGRNWADKEERLALAEEAMELIIAEITDEINNDTVGLLGDGIKPTVANVQAFCIQQPQYKLQKEGIIKLKHEVSIAKIAYIRIGDTRTKALENLVKLHGQNYFAGPSVPRDLGYEAQQKHAQKKSDNKIAKKMKRRPK